MHQTAAILSLRAAAAFRSGSWLTPERLRAYPILLGIVLALAVVALVATRQGNLDHWHRPLGVDFSGVWVAGQAVLSAQPAQPYDNAAHAAAQSAAFGASDSFLPWPYPPYLLAIAGLLATLPYLLALALWQGATGLLYLAAVLRAIAGSGLRRRDACIAALAFPAVAINLVHGQNGFLSAGLLALGAFCLPKRPLLGGLLLGLLAYKPQFAIVVPIAVLAGGHWRAAVAAGATVVAMTLATLLAFGVAPWQAFADSLPFVRHVILEGGGLESWKLQSAFAAIRLLSGSVALAYAAQAAVTATVLVTLAMLWRGDADPRLKVAGLLVAALLATPYAVDYDMVLLGPAIAATAAFTATSPHQVQPYAKSLLAAAWIMPIFARLAAMGASIPAGFLVTAAVYALVLRIARADGAISLSAPQRAASAG